MNHLLSYFPKELPYSTKEKQRTIHQVIKQYVTHEQPILSSDLKQALLDLHAQNRVYLGAPSKQEQTIRHILSATNQPPYNQEIRIQRLGEATANYLQTQLQIPLPEATTGFQDPQGSALRGKANELLYSKNHSEQQKYLEEHLTLTRAKFYVHLQN